MENKIKDFLPNVFGYDTIKKQLKEVYDQYMDRLKNGKDISNLPKGFVFYGEPGNGKTLICREFSKIFNCPVINLQCDLDNINKEIVDAYTKARKNKLSIVIVDEIDNLLGLNCWGEVDPKFLRAFQSQMDGFDKNTSVITLATSNSSPQDWPESLVRVGRLEKKYCMSSSTIVEDLIDGFSKKYNVPVTADEKEELKYEFKKINIAKIESIFSQASIKYGEKAKLNDILKILDEMDLVDHNHEEPDNIERMTAIHEAGHALYLQSHCKRISFLRTRIVDNINAETLSSDKFSTERLDRETLEESIDTSLAGIASEKLILGKYDVGGGSDLTKALKLIDNLLCRGSILDPSCHYAHSEEISYLLKFKYERIKRKYLKSEFNKVYKQLKKEKKQIIKIADFMQKNIGINSIQLKELLSD